MTSKKIRRSPSGPEITISSGGGGAALVFKPGATSENNVFATWPEVVAACAAIAGPRAIWFDPSIAPCIIPSGAWNLGGDDVTFSADGSNLLPSLLTVAPGASVNDCISLFADISVEHQGATPFMKVTRTTPRRVVFAGFATVTPTGTAPLIQNVASPLLIVYADDVATISQGSTPTIDNQLLGATLSIIAAGAALFDTNVLSGVAAGYSGINASPSAFVTAAQAVPGGIIAIANWAQGSEVQYIPSVVADWSGISPENVQRALDRIAAKIGPIP